MKSDSSTVFRSLPLSISFYLSRCICLSLSISSLSVPFYIFRSPSLSLSLSLFVSLSLSLCHFFSLCLSLSFSICLCLSLCLSLSFLLIFYLRQFLRSVCHKCHKVLISTDRVRYAGVRLRVSQERGQHHDEERVRCGSRLGKPPKRSSTSGQPT